MTGVRIAAVGDVHLDADVVGRYRPALDQLGDTAHVFGHQHLCGSPVRQVEEIRFDDIVLRNHDVERSKEHVADRIGLEVVADHEVKLPQNPLMSLIRRRRHVMLPVDQFVPLPVIGKQQEVVVGELYGGTG